MAEYLLFIHGVNTRETREKRDYANPLIEHIQRHWSFPTAVRPISLYWGDVNIEAEQNLMNNYQASPVWDKLYFKAYRSKQLLQFTGDAALYISRAVGKRIVDQLIQQARDGLQEFNPATDNIHLITHSLGTVILFDILFSSRWDATNAGGYQGVEQLRQQIFRGGTPLRSIHTMGSPLGIFSLTTLDDPQVPNTHEVTPRLSAYLQALCGALNAPFPWRNYLHAMDIIATPIEHVLPEMLGVAAQGCLEVKDIITQEASILDRLFSQTSKTLSLGGLEGEVEQIQLVILGGDAHSSYWSSPLVASTITQTIGMTLP